MREDQPRFDSHDTWEQLSNALPGMNLPAWWDMTPYERDAWTRLITQMLRNAADDAISEANLETIPARTYATKLAPNVPRPSPKP